MRRMWCAKAAIGGGSEIGAIEEFGQATVQVMFCCPQSAVPPGWSPEPVCEVCHE